MRKAAVLAALVSMPLFWNVTLSSAQTTGTAAEAKALLDKAVAALKANQSDALAKFPKPDGGFRDRDLYPFCFRIGDGKGVATPLAVPAGTDLRTLKDSTDKAYGQEAYAAAQKPEGQMTEVNYMFPKPGTTTPAVAKVSFVTKVGDLICGVGYYK